MKRLSSKTFSTALATGATALILLSALPARALDNAVPDPNSPQGLADQKAAIDTATLGYTPAQPAPEPLAPITTHKATSSYTACLLEDVRQLDPRSFFSDGFTREEAHCAQSLENNLMPVTGLTRRNFQQVDEYLRAAQYGAAVGQYHSKMLVDNAQVLEQWKTCLAAQASWEATPAPGCESLVKIAKTRFTPAANEARKQLALAQLGGTLRPGFASHPEELVNRGIAPPDDFPMPPRWKEVARPALADDEAATATSAIRGELEKIRERNLSLLSESLRRFGDAPGSGPYTMMKARYDRLKNSSTEELARWGDPAWQTYMIHELDKFRAGHAQSYLQQIVRFPLIAYLPARDPAPKDFVIAMDQVLKNIAERQRRVTKLLKKVEHGGENQIDAIEELTQYPFVNNEVLRARPQDCGIAQAVLENSAYRSQQNNLALMTGAILLGFTGLPTWAMIGTDLAFVADGLRTDRANRIRDVMDAYTTALGPVKHEVDPSSSPVTVETAAESASNEGKKLRTVPLTVGGMYAAQGGMKYVIKKLWPIMALGVIGEQVYKRSGYAQSTGQTDQ